MAAPAIPLVTKAAEVVRLDMVPKGATALEGAMGPILSKVVGRDKVVR